MSRSCPHQREGQQDQTREPDFGLHQLGCPVLDSRAHQLKDDHELHPVHFSESINYLSNWAGYLELDVP